MAKKKPAPKAVKPAKKGAVQKPVKKAAAVKKTTSVKKLVKAKPVASKKSSTSKAGASSAKATSEGAKKKDANAVKKTAPHKVVKTVAKKSATKPLTKAAPKKVVTTSVKKTTTTSVQKDVTPKASTKSITKSAPAKPTAKVAAPKAKKVKTKKAPEPKLPPKPLVTQGAGPNMPRVTPMVKKQVSTLEAGDKQRYSDTDLDEFRTIINAKLDEARKDYDLLKQTLANTDNNGTEDTSPSFKMIEDGSETLGREETAQLAGRQEKFIKHLEDALLRIRNKTYGICRVTGKLISKERLRLVPHATLSIEAKQQMSN